MKRLESLVNLAGRKSVVVLSLVGLVLIAYFNVWSFEFVNIDDDLYLTDYPEIQRGLSWDNFLWASTAMVASFWHPLTWLSHMLDTQLYGLNPAGHHVTNLFLHIANVLLLFALLRRMTGALWSSALVAALFALHPLNVESVAWVSQRKTLLSTLFWLLTLMAYVGYVEKPDRKRYLAMVGLFVLGLMAKPMLVTLPFVLLLLDYWPLGRLGQDAQQFRERLPRLAAEKLPLFIPAAVASLLAIQAQAKMGSISSWEGLPLGVRLGNAVLSYGLYLKKMLWPTDLAVFYPHPGTSLTLWPVALAALVLAGLSLGVWWRGQRSPYLVVGWLWYLGTLFPVSGLIQVGGHALADRYAYVTLVGLFVIVVWGAAELARIFQFPKTWLPVAGVGVIAVLIPVTRLQLSYWQNSFTLFEHALETTQNNHMAHSNLGIAFLGEDELDEAIDHFTRALQIKPTHAGVQTNLSIALRRQGLLDDSLEHAVRAVAINPNLAEAHNNLGISLFQKGRVEEALEEFQRALELKPDYTTCYYNMGVVLENQDRMKEASESYRQALRLDPEHRQASQRLTLLLEKMNQRDKEVKP